MMSTVIAVVSNTRIETNSLEPYNHFMIYANIVRVYINL